MPSPPLRSRTVKRKTVRTPGGKVTLHTISKKHDYPKCAMCKRPLHGYPRLTAREEHRGHRPPTRIYGGYVCSTCLRKGLKAAVELLYKIDQT